MRIERKRYWMRRVSWGWSSNGEHGPYRVSDLWWLTLRCIIWNKRWTTGENTRSMR